MVGKFQKKQLSEGKITSNEGGEVANLKKEISQLKSELTVYKKKLSVFNEIAEEGVVIHENFIIQEANKAFSKLTGYSQDELPGMSCNELLTKDSLEVMKKNILNASSVPAEVKMKTRDGRLIKVLAKGKSFKINKKTLRSVIIRDITEIKRTQESLAESEERHRLISNLLSDYIYTCRILPGKSPEIGWVSGALENITGYTAEEIGKLKQGWLSIIHPEDFKKVSRTVDYSSTIERYYTNEYRIIDKHGNTKWLLDRSMCIHYEDSTEEVTLLGAVKDVTHSKKIEEDLRERNLEYEKLNNNLNQINIELFDLNEKLRESELKYKTLIENSEVGVGISKNEKILFANKALLDIYGLKTFEEFSSRKLTDYMTAESKKLVRGRLKKLNNNAPVDKGFRYQIIRADGEFRTLETITNDVEYDGQKCRQALIRDITKQLETENALQQAANIFRNIQIGLLIYRLDELGNDRSLRLLAANPASAQLIGLPVEEMVGKTIDTIFPNLRKKKIPQYYAEVVRTQQPIAFDDIYYEDNRISAGSYSIKVFPLPDQCVGISFENVSARRQAENELRIRNNELNNFVYKVSHDLRAPLSSIRGLINLSKLEQNQTNHLPKIEERINHLDGFIRDILSHSRNLNTAVVIEKLDVEQIVYDCFKELDYLPNAKSTQKSVVVQGGDFYNDKIRFYEISRNMVSNAIKYQDPEKKKHYVNVNVEITPDLCSITFEDNGIGIKKKFKDSIFEMFYRATDVGEGSGIGLYIVKQAIEKLNGKISVESKSKMGSSFKVELPNLIS